MTCWNEEQLGHLKKLKRDLGKRERTEESLVDLSKVNPSRLSRGESQLDNLFARLASKGEGIQYRIGERWVSAPLGQLDSLLFKLANNIGVGPPKMAIGLPRVPVGISTWLAVSVMISRVAFSQASRLSDSYVPGMHTRWILIACRERALRDLYLSQRIIFTGQPFLVNSFPIYRFRRDGGIQPISWAKPNPLSTPVLFYHFDNIDFTQSDIDRRDIALIVAEISESDSRLSRTMLERLNSVRTFNSEPKTLLFFNSFDDQMRNYLMLNDYEIIHIKPDSSVSGQIAIIPTIKETFSCYPCPQEVSIEIVRDDYDISQSLLECARDLARVNEELESVECRRVLAKWWNLWRILKDLAIPLDIYERYRMHAQGRGSLENAITSISNLTNRIQTLEGKSLQSVGPVISNRLRSIYQALTQSCPKAERLMSLLNESKSNVKQDTLFILSEKGQVDALREHFLFTDVDLLDTQIPITYLSQGVATSRKNLFHRCILPGVWAPWQDSILVAIGASNITVLMYPYEAALLETRIREHVDECALLTKSSLNKESYKPIITLPEEQRHILKTIREMTKEDVDISQPPEWLKIEPEFAVDLLESEEIVSEEAQATEGLFILFDDGSSLVARPHSEMMLVTDDNVESVFATELSEGDTVAVIRDDITRSIFQSVLAQVNHLVRVDNRVIDLWRSSLKSVRFGSQTTMKIRSISSIINSLHDLGCSRVDLTIRQWFRGTTLAPHDVEDIRRVLELAGVQRPYDISKVVSREIEIIRAFNRRLGRRINERVRTSITGGKHQVKERIDFEIDEAIEAVEYRTITSIKPLNGEN